MRLLKYSHVPCYKTIILTQQAQNAFTEPDFLLTHFIWNLHDYQGMHIPNVTGISLCATQSLIIHYNTPNWKHKFQFRSFKTNKNATKDTQVSIYHLLDPNVSLNRDGSWYLPDSSLKWLMPLFSKWSQGALFFSGIYLICKNQTDLKNQITPLYKCVYNTNRIEPYIPYLMCSPKYLGALM